MGEAAEAARQTYTAILALTDLAFLTLDDEASPWGDADEAQCLARTSALGVSEIVKRGAGPASSCSPDDHCEVMAVALAREQIVDTTAAGDSFSAGYLATRLAGQSVIDSARYAHRLASTVIQHRGAIIP